MNHVLSVDNINWHTSGRSVVLPQQAKPGVAGPVSGVQCCVPQDGSRCDPGYLSPGLIYWQSPQNEARKTYYNVTTDSLIT